MMNKIVLACCLSFMTVGFLKGQGMDTRRIELHNTGAEYFNKRNFEKAKEAFTQVLNLDENHVESNYQKHHCHYYLGEYDSALYHLDKAYELKALNKKYFYNKGRILDRLRERERAIDNMDMALMYDVSNLFYLTKKANLLLESERYKEAIKAYDEVLEIDEEKYALYFNRGIAKHNLKQYKEACLDWYYAKDHYDKCNKYYFYKCSKVKITGGGPYVPKEYAPVYSVDEVFDRERFVTLVRDGVKFPSDVFMEDISGMALYQLEIGEKSNHVKVLRSIDIRLDSLVLSYLKDEVGKLKGGMKKGEKVRYNYLLPIRFGIDDMNFSYRTLKDSVVLYYEKGKFEKARLCLKQVMDYLPLDTDVKYYAKLLNKRLSSEKQLNIKYFDELASDINEILPECKVSPIVKKMYFNEAFELTNPEEASFYRITAWDGIERFFTGEFKDIDMQGNVLLEGAYYRRQKTGVFKSYYKSGSPRALMHFENNNPVGLWHFYHADGTVANSVLMEKEFVVSACMDSLNHDLLPEGNGEWRFESENSLHKITGVYKEFKRVGSWKYYRDSVLVIEDLYNKKGFAEGKFYDGDYVYTTNQPNVTSWTLVPEYVEGVELLNRAAKAKPYSYYYIKAFNIGHY